MDHEVDRVLGHAERIVVEIVVVEYFDRDPGVGKEDWAGRGEETWRMASRKRDEESVWLRAG